MPRNRPRSVRAPPAPIRAPCPPSVSPDRAGSRVGPETCERQDTMPRRFHLISAAVVIALAAVVGCQGPLCIFGYQLGADALYDPNIKTVCVPVFTNRAFQTTPYRGMEVDITRAVVKEIGAKTKFKVVSDPDRADTELRGNIVSIGKNILNRNQQNLTREAEVVLVVDVLWWDLRTCKNLTAPRGGA